MPTLLFRDGLLFVAAISGLGLPWLPLVRAWPAREQLMLAVGAALLTGWLAGFGLYAAGVPLGWFWLCPAAGLLGIAVHPAPTRHLLGDAAVRGTLGRWAWLALGCLGWHCVVVNYSGASWQGDWYEHFDRTHFFLDRWPLEFLFLDYYPLPSRPPLVNLWAAQLMSGAGGGYAHFQVFMTLLSSTVFLPLAVIVRRAEPRARGEWLLLVLLLLNPLLVQNATFPWTKLTAAFFVLTAWCLLAPGAAPVARGRMVAAALALAGGMLAHYSTGPWLLAFALAWWLACRVEARDRAWRRETLLAAALAATVLLTWVGWAVAHYGLRVTFTQNTAVDLAPGGPGDRLVIAGLNLLHTLSPVSLVGLDHPMLAQTSALGRLRDGWFILYQLKLWWAVGSVGGCVLLWLLRHEPASALRRFAFAAAVTVVLTGNAVHGLLDLLGLTHVVLQPLVLLGLAWIAARAATLPAWLARAYAAGLGVDFLMGIALHFALQAGWMLRAAKPWDEYTRTAEASWRNKHTLHLSYLADQGGLAWGPPLVAAAVVAAIWGWQRARTRAEPPGPVPTAACVTAAVLSSTPPKA